MIRFRRSSKKLDRAVEQLELLIGDIEETVAKNEVQAETAERIAMRDARGMIRLEFSDGGKAQPLQPAMSGA
ncbi:MAG: hypothetical protein ACLPSF_05945 [Methylocella sp.]